MKQLEIRNLVKTYDNKKVVDDVNLIVKQGQVTGLLAVIGNSSPHQHGTNTSVSNANCPVSHCAFGKKLSR